MDWPWSKVRKIICPDGDTRFVYKDINHAFPMYFKDLDVQANAAISTLDATSGKVEGAYRDQIKGLLFQVNRNNASIQAHFRAAYAIYMAAPCTKLTYLEEAVQDIRRQEHSLRAAELSARELFRSVDAITKGGRGLDSAQASIKEGVARISAILEASLDSGPITKQMAGVSDLNERWKA